MLQLKKKDQKVVDAVYASKRENKAVPTFSDYITSGLQKFTSKQACLRKSLKLKILQYSARFSGIPKPDAHGDHMILCTK